MNSKSVLSKIGKLLNFADETTIQAKTDDGKILTSANFDLNDAVLEVAADGTTSPLADGEYTITYTTPEGVDVTAVVDIDGGKISEISTPSEEADETSGAPEESGEEQMADADATKDKTKPLPGDPSKVNDDNEDEPTKLAGVLGANGELGAHPEDSKPGPIPQTTDKPELDLAGIASKLEEMAYRISELEKAAAPSDEKGNEKADDTNEDEDKDLPKLDGAPVEASMMFTQQENQKRYGKKEGSAQNTFLSKLYGNN